VLKMLLSSSIALVALNGCVHSRPFPVDELYEFDRELDTCAVYTLVNKETFKFAYKKDLPRAECPNIFGFTADDTAKVLDWAADRIAEGKLK